MDNEVAQHWYLVAATLGAFGDQLLYWRNALARGRGARVWRVSFSVLYILTGGGIGFFVGVEQKSLLLALGTGGAWPTALKAMNDVRLWAEAARQKFGLAGGEG